MGLDQYLTAEVYVGAKYHKVKQEALEVSNNFMPSGKGEDFTDCKVFPTHNISNITYDIGYWRKANWIHKWFVDNVQGGKDDCERYVVSYDALEKLETVCKEIRDAYLGKLKKEELIKLIMDKLPTQSGFFFEGTVIETDEDLEYYMETITDTLVAIDLAKKYDKEYGATIYYQSSW